MAELRTGRLLPPAQWRLTVPEDATLQDVIAVLNDVKITFTVAQGGDEYEQAALFRQFGPSAVYFRRLKDEET